MTDLATNPWTAAHFWMLVAAMVLCAVVLLEIYLWERYHTQDVHDTLHDKGYDCSKLGVGFLMWWYAIRHNSKSVLR